MARIKQGRVPELSQVLPDADEELADFFRTALHKNPARRPATARELRERLEALRHGWRRDEDCKASRPTRSDESLLSVESRVLMPINTARPSPMISGFIFVATPSPSPTGSTTAWSWGCIIR